MTTFLENVVVLVCFKVADFFNVCDAISLDVDPVIEQLYGIKKGSENWIRSFLKSFSALYKLE